MASRYVFSNEEIRGIEQARKVNKDKRVEKRLKALELRAKGASAKDVSDATGYHTNYVSRLVTKYCNKGLEGIIGNHYGGNRRNLSVEEEKAILAPFKECAEKGQVIVSDKAFAFEIVESRIGIIDNL